MALEWVTDAGFGYDIAPCMLIEDQGKVIVGTKNGLVFALDRADGRVLWRRKVGVTVLATPVIVPGGLLVSDLDGRVTRLQYATD
jgi:outer membrane protein assembly factor BamB